VLDQGRLHLERPDPVGDRALDGLVGHEGGGLGDAGEPADLQAGVANAL
jgi:hypothetical protein